MPAVSTAPDPGTLRTSSRRDASILYLGPQVLREVFPNRILDIGLNGLRSGEAPSSRTGGVAFLLKKATLCHRTLAHLLWVEQ